MNRSRERMPPPSQNRAGSVTDTLLRTDLFAIEVVACHHGPADWTPIRPASRFSLFAARRGVFRRRVLGRDMFVDPVTAYFERPGLEQQVAHLDHGDHEALAIVCSDRLVDQLGAAESLDVLSPLRTPPQHDFMLRLLAARLRHGAIDPFGAEELVVGVVANLLDGPATAAPAPFRPATRRAWRRIVDDARQAIAADPSLSLGALADEVAISPYHLSRVFRQVTGETLSRWRNELRVRAALDRLESGEDSLAAVAADLGFADHAHLSRVVRDHLGAPPSVLRGRLTPPKLFPATRR